MSDLAEKLERAPASRDNVARCTLEQLHRRWGQLADQRGALREALESRGGKLSLAEAAKVLRVGDTIAKDTMGAIEYWRVTSIAEGRVHLERVG